MISGHGGNVHETARLLGCAPEEILDMSSNTNPFGPPEPLLRYLKDHFSVINALPEADAGGAIAAFAHRWGVDACRVLAGNGTTQFIYTIPLALETRKALVVGPTYADYADGCSMHGVPVRYVLTTEDDNFHIDFTALEARLRGCDTVFICNPNNPTGVFTPVDRLARFIRSHSKIRFVVDESYLPFVQNRESESLIRQDLPNVVVLHSMSKIFRIPGLRIGFVVSSAENIRLMGEYALPWSVNSLSQIAVAYLLGGSAEVADFISYTQQALAAERTAMIKHLEASCPIRCFPSTTSFLLFKLPASHTARRVHEALARRKVLIRNCSNFMGLSDRFIRISLNVPGRNRMVEHLLVEALRG